MDVDREREMDVSLGATQLVVSALGMGVISLYVIAAVLVLSNALGLTPAQGFPLPAIGCIVAAVLTFASFIVKGLMLKRAGQMGQAARLAPLDLLLSYRKATIVAAAMCDAGAMALGVFVIAAGPGSLPWLAGGIVPLSGFALHFPTREKLGSFLAEYRTENDTDASE